MKAKGLRWQVLADLGTLSSGSRYLAGFVYAASCLARSQWVGSQNYLFEPHFTAPPRSSFSVRYLWRKQEGEFLVRHVLRRLVVSVIFENAEPEF
jgi:hypothetical protein